MHAMQEETEQAPSPLPVLAGGVRFDVKLAILKMLGTLNVMQEDVSTDQAPVPLPYNSETFGTILSCLRVSLQEKVPYGQRVADIAKILQKNCPTKEQTSTILRALNFLQITDVQNPFGIAFVLYFVATNPEVGQYVNKAGTSYTEYTDLPQITQALLPPNEYDLLNAMWQHADEKSGDLPPLAREALNNRKARTAKKIRDLLKKDTQWDCNWNCLACLPGSADLQKLDMLHKDCFFSPRCFYPFAWSDHHLPDEIGALRGLKELMLEGNFLESLSAAIGSLAELEKLVLKNNELTALPAEMAALLELRRLDLSKNKFSSFPLAICGMSKLEELGLSRNELSTLPSEVTFPASLHVLELSGNKLTSVPPTLLSNCSSLVNLDLGGNKLTSIPSTFGDLTNLTVLTLRCNQIEKLPEEIGNCHLLKSLDLFWNKLTSLPPTIDSLCMLRCLNLAHNQITELPDEIGNCQSLEVINLDQNKLSTIPATIGALHRLRILCLGYNRITELPDRIGDCTMLEKLNVCFNYLRTLPATLNTRAIPTFIDLGNELSNPRSKFPVYIGE